MDNGDRLSRCCSDDGAGRWVLRLEVRAVEEGYQRHDWCGTVRRMGTLVVCVGVVGADICLYLAAQATATFVTRAIKLV